MNRTKIRYSEDNGWYYPNATYPSKEEEKKEKKISDRWKAFLKMMKNHKTK